MHKFSLKGKRPKEKYHSYKGNIGKIADNIISRDFSASRPDEKWTTDVSQFNLSFGKCYLSPILDMYTNEIISYDLSLHPNFEQITSMLDKAFQRHPDVSGLIFHSDQGWQYQMRHYTETLKSHGIIQSMSRKGNCIDNCIMETFFGRMKTEMFYGHEKEYPTFEHFSKAVDEYIYYYNNQRIQKKTKWMPPVLFRKASIHKFCDIVWLFNMSRILGTYQLTDVFYLISFLLSPVLNTEHRKVIKLFSILNKFINSLSHILEGLFRTYIRIHIKRFYYSVGTEHIFVLIGGFRQAIRIYKYLGTRFQIYFILRILHMLHGTQNKSVFVLKHFIVTVRVLYHRVLMSGIAGRQFSGGDLQNAQPARDEHLLLIVGADRFVGFRQDLRR